MELHLKIIGTLLVILSFIHIVFPRYFNWSKELSGLSLINRQMIYVHTFFIALVLFLMGVLCITSSTEIVGTVLGHRIAFGLGIFWLIRLLIQFFGYSHKLWKGKVFETTIHIIFSAFWAYLTIVFFTIWGKTI